MKIEIETDESLREPEVIVRCAVMDERIVSIVAGLRMHDRKMTGESDGEVRIVSVGEIQDSMALCKERPAPFPQARYSTSNPSTADALPTQPQLFWKCHCVSSSSRNALQMPTSYASQRTAS